ncbi:MAG: AMP-binding protein [Ectobacillus sp.]
MGVTASYTMLAKRQPSRLAVVTAKKSVTYKQWNDSVCQVANWLTYEGDNKIIALLLGNCLEFLQLFAGAAAAGWVCVPLDTNWNESELRERLAEAKPAIIVSEQHLLHKLPKTAAKVMTIEEIEDVIKYFSSRFYQDIERKNLPFYMGFTSGSTGKPKAFVRSQQSWVESFACNIHDFQMSCDECVCIPGALVHSLFLYGAISTLYLGGTVYLLEKFVPATVLSTLESEPITAMYAVPTMIEALYKLDTTVNRPFRLISSGAKWEAEAKRRIRALFPYVKMYEFYGASELSFVTVLNEYDNQLKPSSVGRACHNVEIGIRNDKNEEVKQGEIGRIYVKSKQIFMGYIENGAITNCVTEEGWLTVYDLGYMDEAGYLYIAGRERNMIVYGGINIFPEEIERVLLAHQDVEEAAVVGIEDLYWGEIAVAVIQGKTTSAALKKYCMAYLSAYKIPKRWYFVEHLPYTTSGKIARKQVKEMIKQVYYG